MKIHAKDPCSFGKKICSLWYRHLETLANCSLQCSLDFSPPPTGCNKPLAKKSQLSPSPVICHSDTQPSEFQHQGLGDVCEKAEEDHSQSQWQDNSHLRQVALTDNTHPQYISQHTIKHDPIEHQHIEGQEPRVQKGTDDKLISEEKTEHLISVHVIIPNFNTRRQVEKKPNILTYEFYTRFLLLSPLVHCILYQKELALAILRLSEASCDIP